MAIVETLNNIYKDTKMVSYRTGLVGNFPGVLVAKTLLPMLGASFPSLVWELDSTCHNLDLAQPDE